MPGESSDGFAALGADPDEAERRIHDWARGFAEKAERYQAVQQQTEQLRLTASSQDGRIKVTVRADGSVADLEFTDKVRQLQPSELSSQILATMHRAQADIADRVGQVMTANLGEEDQQTRSMMLDNLRERFPEQPTEPEPEVQPSTWDSLEAQDEDQHEPEPPQPPRSQPPHSEPPQSPRSQNPQPPRSPHRGRLDDDDDDGEFPPDFDPLRD